MNLEAFRLWSLLRKCSVFCMIFLVVTLTLEIHTYLAASATRSVALVWSQPPEQDVLGYKVYYGPVSRYEDTFDEYLYVEDLQPGDYDVQDEKVHYVLNSVDENLSYWVSVTAYDHQGNESAYSNEKEIGTTSGAKATSSGSGGCQTAPVSEGSKVGARAGMTGWIFLCLVVPGWILLLRFRVVRSSDLFRL